MPKKVDNKIYVIGFPKSGNTWLTRLLADVLQCPAGSGMVDDDLEIATDQNRLLSKKNDNPEFQVLKSHFLPEHQNKFDQGINRIIYIKRDLRDIIVSTFHYGSSTDENTVIKTSFVTLFTKSPKKILRYLKNRYRFKKTVKKVSHKWSDNVGSWDEHINKWEEVKNGNPEIHFANTTYEDLLKDTEKEIVQILKQLELPIPSEQELVQAIERQSFRKKKEYFQNLPDDYDIPRGKKFNYRFLRKGVAGEWKKYFTPRLEKMVNRSQGEALAANGYKKTIE